MSKGNFYYKNKNRKRGSNQEFRSENEILSQSKAKREDLLRPIEDLQLRYRISAKRTVSRFPRQWQNIP